MTTTSTAPDLRYPIGKFEWSGTATAADRQRYIDAIERLPQQLRDAVRGLSDEQLDTRYRPEGWTLRQVVHHLGDSHLNSQLRFRFALTEHEPPIRSYDENAWVQLADALGPIEPSLILLEGLHQRWVTLLRSFTDKEFARTFRHSEQGLVNLDRTTALYAWHGAHHLAHITEACRRNGW